MTTPESRLTPCSTPDQPMPDPFVEWLVANGIDLNRIPMFPDFMVTESAEGWIVQIEGIYRRGAGPTERPSVFFGRQPAIWWRTQPLIVQPDMDMLDAYRRARTAWLREETIKEMGHAGCTIINPGQGDGLILVTAAEVPSAAYEALLTRFGGLNLTVVERVHTVVHVPAPQ